MKTIKVFSVAELKERFPKAFEKVLSKWQEEEKSFLWQEDMGYYAEAIEVCKALCKRFEVQDGCFYGRLAIETLEGERLEEKTISFKLDEENSLQGWIEAKLGASLEEMRDADGGDLEKMECRRTLAKALLDGEQLEEALKTMLWESYSLQEKELEFQTDEEHFLEKVEEESAVFTAAGTTA